MHVQQRLFLSNTLHAGHTWNLLVSKIAFMMLIQLPKNALKLTLSVNLFIWHQHTWNFKFTGQFSLFFNMLTSHYETKNSGLTIGPSSPWSCGWCLIWTNAGSIYYKRIVIVILYNHARAQEEDCVWMSFCICLCTNSLRYKQVHVFMSAFVK